MKCKFFWKGCDYRDMLELVQYIVSESDGGAKSEVVWALRQMSGLLPELNL